MRERGESIDILAAEVRDQLGAQLTHFESLDAKAGVLLGSAGLLVALAPGSADLWIDAARLAGVVSAALSLIAFLPRDYPVLDLERLRESHPSAGSELLRLVVLDARVEMFERARELNDQKAGRLKMATFALLGAILLAFAGLFLESSSGGTR